MAVTAKRPLVVNLMASGKYLIVLLKYKGTRQNQSTKVSGKFRVAARDFPGARAGAWRRGRPYCGAKQSTTSDRGIAPDTFARSTVARSRLRGFVLMRRTTQIH
jgi:hypothetical protein